MPGEADQLVVTSREHVGDNLRTVATYADREYNIHHLREDIDQSYSTVEIQQVFDDLVLSGLSNYYLEQIFHAGRIECTIYGFEDAAMFHFVTGEGRGAFVSFDREADVDLDTFIEDSKAVVAAKDLELDDGE